MSGVSETAACPPSLLLMIFQLYHLPPPITLLARSLNASPYMPADLLCLSRYYAVRLKTFYFLCLFFMHYLCEKYYKPIIVQYYLAGCVSCIPRLNLLDL